MKIEKNKVVEIVYEMVVDGQTVEKTTEERPLGYIHGTGSLLKNFENRVEGLEAGSEFAFELSPAESHGEYDPNRVIEMSKEAFVIDGKFREDLIVAGNVIPLMGSDGAVVRGVIVSVKEDSVTIDTNNQFAGKGMSFRGRVISVRDATEKELKEGLYGERCGHGCGGCGHHGEKGGNCGGGCGHHDGENECCGHGDGNCGGGCCCGEDGCDCKS